MDAKAIENQVLTYIQRNGPVLPIQVSKIIEKDMFLTGAMLSELIRRGLVRITTAKIGGSPLYYSPGQESKLFVLYNHLPLKERQAYDLLQKEVVVKDSETEPSIRVAFSNIRDFAVPFEFEVDDKKELFWRWHLLNKEEAEQRLKQMYMPIVVQTTVSEVKKIEPVIEIKKPEVKPEKIEEIQTKIKHKRLKETEDLLLMDATNYLKGKKIHIFESNVIKKNKEIEFVASIPSEVGNLNYLVIVKNKSKISDSDLLHAYQKAQERKLPALLISKGELSKKASKYLEEKLKGVAFRKI